MRPGLSELLLQEAEIARLEVGAGLDPEPVHLLRRRSDAVEFLDAEGLDEGRSIRVTSR